VKPVMPRISCCQQNRIEANGGQHEGAGAAFAGSLAKRPPRNSRPPKKHGRVAARRCHQVPPQEPERTTRCSGPSRRVTFAEALKGQKFEVDKRQVPLAEPSRTLANSPVTVKVFRGRNRRNKVHVERRSLAKTRTFQFAAVRGTKPSCLFFCVRRSAGLFLKKVFPDILSVFGRGFSS